MRRLLTAYLLAAALGFGIGALVKNRSYWCDMVEPGSFLAWFGGCNSPAGGGDSGAQ